MTIYVKMEILSMEINAFYDDIIRQATMAREAFVAHINQTIYTCEILRKKALFVGDRESWLYERGKTDFDYNYEINLKHRWGEEKSENSFAKSVEKELTDDIVFYQEKTSASDDDNDTTNNESDNDSVLTECSTCYSISEFFINKDTSVEHIGKGKKLAILLSEAYPFATENRIDDLYDRDAYLKDLIRDCNGVAHIRPIEIKTSVHYNFGRRDEPEPDISVILVFFIDF